MGNTTRLAAFGVAVLAAGCGGGGSSAGAGSGYNAGAAFGVVELLSHSPADGAVQVALDSYIQLEFDADIALESLADEDTWLRVAGTTTNVPITFTRGSSGRVACQPDADLLPETDYEFQLSALTSDLSGRILDVTTKFTFRTFDESPPQITGFSVPDGATGVARTGTFTLSFDEALSPASIDDQTLYLRDVFNGRFAAEATVVGNDVVLDPHADLPGDRQFFVVATTLLTDRAGNALATQFQSSFRTAADTDSPAVTAAWPALNATGISPLAQPWFTFDESMDPATVEPSSLLFQDEYGSIVPFAIDASADQQRLRVRPTVALQPNRSYTLAFLLGAAAATDVSGNGLVATQALTFTTGTDQTAPTVVSSSPSSGQQRVPGALVAEVTFDEDLDPAFVDSRTVELLVDGAPWAAVVTLVDGDTVRVTPVLDLPTDTNCTLRLRGDQDGLHDLAGNVPGDILIPFTTSSDAEAPGALFLPPDGAVAIAPSSRITIVFDAAMDPATLTPQTIQVTDDFYTPIAGTMTLSADNRVVTFDPAAPLSPNAYYRVRLVGGNTGARRVSGNWFDADRTARFRTGQNNDVTAPTVTATINGIPEVRQEGLVVPPSGFTVDVTTGDVASQWVDMGTVELLFTGGQGPGAEALLAQSRIGYNSVQVTVPDELALAPGSWSLQVRARDLSGNVGQSTVLSFEVDAATGGALPFERTQVVWVRTDLDRDGNGRSDFTDDMLRLGFASEDDPAGTNAWMERLLLDGILAKANHLYKRGNRGEPLDAGSVMVRFSTREPIALPHMQIALGGLDPDGDRTRAFGAESTGVLGRAYYDYRNDNPSERNTSVSPGLGVFPAEMYLYQGRIHQQVYPSYQTAFASAFLPICPAMGGTPAGSHPHDATVLSPTFDYASATASERARYNTVMSAADDWAAVIGVILAHEVGHSIGLVAPGAMPNGLFGDSSLHNTYASAAEVMAPSVGYEAMTSLDYQFRDIDLAYLRQRILLR